MHRSETFRFRTKLYKLREEKDISPRAFAHLVSSTLYSKRFGPYYAEPVIGGLAAGDEPFICSTDLIGCINWAKDFVVSGTAAPSLYGICEALYEPDLVRCRICAARAQTLRSAHTRPARCSHARCRSQRTSSSASHSASSTPSTATHTVGGAPSCTSSHPQASSCAPSRAARTERRATILCPSSVNKAKAPCAPNKASPLACAMQAAPCTVYWAPLPLIS